VSVLGGQPVRLLTYNGRFPGPLIRAREGDLLRVALVNRLDEPTNLHFHGLHVPPTGRADNIWLHIPPGETLVYEFEVPRGIAGTYWYHPHAHGTIARQLWAGLAGPLIVEGPLEAMPELAGADERIAVLKDLALDERGRPTPHRVHDWHEGKQGDLLLVNGAVQPQLRARAGTLRLRLINASNARYFRLALSDGEPLHLIATDGHYIEKPVDVAEVLLVPGERADVLVQPEPGRILELRDLAYDRRTTHHSKERTLMTILPVARAAGPALPRRLDAVHHHGDVLHERPAVRPAPGRRPRSARRSRALAGRERRHHGPPLSSAHLVLPGDRARRPAGALPRLARHGQPEAGRAFKAAGSAFQLHGQDRLPLPRLGARR
jgi:FtsP/CotA-like multicopper oxidase with cupredoxin domain